MKRCIFLLVLLPFTTSAQTDSLKFALVKKLSKQILSQYLNLNVGHSMCDTVMHKLKTNRYDTSLTIDEFVYEVTKDLRRVSNDNHIYVMPTGEKLRSYYEGVNWGVHSKRFIKRFWKKQARRNNKIQKARRRPLRDMFTYGEIKILPGNIGYAEIKDFSGASRYRKYNRHRIKLKSVLRYLRKTDAVILDFRENLGGYISLAAYTCSYFSATPYNYFISTESVYRYDSSGNQIVLTIQRKDSTAKNITNQFTQNKKIAVLTSCRTFSAGELVTYKLKHLNSNTTVIGEKTTGGGNGHTGGYYDDYYFAVIPSVKVYDEQNGNYQLEGHGVTPDIVTSADSALSVAYHQLLSPDADTTRKKTRYYKKHKEASEAWEATFRYQYPNYPGDYRKAKITTKNGKLFITYDLYEKLLLTPDAHDYFSAEGFEYVRFIRNDAHEVVEIALKHKSGYLEKFRRLSAF